MISMNIQSDEAQPASYDNSPTVYLSCEQCEALGITKAPQPGTVYMLKVRAVAKRVTAEMEEAEEVAAEGDAPDISLTLVLTDIEISNGGGGTATMLYSDT